MRNSIARFGVYFLVLLALFGCENHQVIITNIDEKEANQIVVFLASKGITSEKVTSASVSPGGGDSGTYMFNIAVDGSIATQAMALLNQNGLPRKQGTTLLELFAKQGLMSTEKEETIRYQAGLAQQIANTIRKIDGVLDADVELSFPPPETGLPGAGPERKVTASVYVKHQGILDDPNSHLPTKIKLLVAASVNGLSINDVTVISDRSRFAEVNLGMAAELISAKPQEYVSVWSIVMNQASVPRFRTLFTIMCFIMMVLLLALAWLVWKFYPILRRLGGIKALLQPAPLDTEGRSLPKNKPE